MRTLLAILLACIHSSGNLIFAEDADPTFYTIVHEKVRAVMLIDGEPMILASTSHQPDPQARQYESSSAVFSIVSTEKGQLIVARPMATHDKQNVANSSLEGTYMTADYSTDPPSIKFAKEPEKGSYWEIPEIGGYLALHTSPKPAAIVNKCEQGTRYLSILPETVSLTHPLQKGHQVFRRVGLTPKDTDLFQVQRINPNEEGR
jgi:hypothetical protein